MTIYLFDRNRHREWGRMLPGGFRELAWIDAEGDFDTRPVTGDLVVCHRVQDPIEREALAELSEQGVFMLEVGGDDRRPAPPQGTVYRRAKAVLNDDPSFAAAFAVFVAELERTGAPQWSLLESAPTPDALLAYHLLRLLPSDSEAQEQRESLRAAAIAEGRAIAATGSRARFDERLLDDVAELAKFLADHL